MNIPNISSVSANIGSAISVGVSVGANTVKPMTSKLTAIFNATVKPAASFAINFVKNNYVVIGAVGLAACVWSVGNFVFKQIALSKSYAETTARKEARARIIATAEANRQNEDQEIANHPVSADLEQAEYLFEQFMRDGEVDARRRSKESIIFKAVRNGRLIIHFGPDKRYTVSSLSIDSDGKKYMVLHKSK